MKVKHKLLIALIFLFGVIILLGTTGIYYLRWLADDSAAIMKDNNRTLTYMRKIESNIDQILYLKLERKQVSKEPELDRLISEIEELKKKQGLNVTEPGEKELTEKLNVQLARFYGLLDSRKTPVPGDLNMELFTLTKGIKELTGAIYLINEQTMLHKNEQANQTAENTIMYMAIFGSASILIGFVFIIGLPGYIAKPLSLFNQSIKEVARGNYQVKIPEESRNEYGELAASFNKMAAKLDEYEHSNLAKLLKEQKRLNALIDQLDEAVLGLDEHKDIIFVNKKCLSLLNMEKSELIGKYAPDVATNNQLMNSMIKELMIGFMKGEEKTYKAIKVIDGKRERLFSKNIIDVNYQPTGENREVSFGFVVILTDITDFAEKDKAKTHFIATLSHELKTPVSAIQMGTDLLKNSKSGGLQVRQLELVETIESNTARIGRIIREILDLSKIESGTIDVNATEEYPQELIEKAVEGVEMFLKEKDLKIAMDIPIILPQIKVDPHKTVWVLNNFLTNAIRYAPSGSEIWVSGVLVGGRVRISVSDEGPGIAEEDQVKIFQKFTKLKKSEASGTGLGLAISKEFIQAMGGKIGVESKLGEGASFWIECKAKG